LPAHVEPHAPVRPSPKPAKGDHAWFGISIDLEALISSHGAAGRLLINLDVHIPRLIDAHGEIALHASVDTVAHAASVAISAAAQLTALGHGDHLSEEARARALDAAHTVHAWIERHHPKLKALAAKSPALHGRIGHILGALGTHHGHLSGAREKLRKGRAGKQVHGKKHAPNRHGVTEHHVHQVNSAFAKSLEHARTHAHKPKHHGMHGHLGSMVEKRHAHAAHSDNLLRTLESLAVANGRALIDPHGGSMRNTAAKVDALIGKLRGKAGRELAAGAHEIGGLLGEMNRVAQSAGTAHHLGNFKHMLEERAHELRQVAEAVEGKVEHAAGALALKAKGILAQPSILAKGEKALAQLKKIHPDLEKMLKGASHSQLGKELANLSHHELGKLRGLATMLKPEASKLVKGISGVGTSMLGKLGLGHLAGLGSGHSMGALGALGGGALGRLAHHLEKEIKAKGGKEIGKPAPHDGHKAPNAHAVSQAMASHGKHELSAHLKVGGALHSLVGAANHSHGTGLGALVSPLLHSTGTKKMSEAMRLVEGLKKDGHKPRFACRWYSNFKKSVSSAVSSVASVAKHAVASTVSAASSLARATVSTVKSRVSSVAHNLFSSASTLARMGKSLVGKVARGAKSFAHAVGSAAHRVGSGVSHFAHAVGSSVRKGVRSLAHTVSSGAHTAGDWARTAYRATTSRLHSAWDATKSVAHKGWEMGAHAVHSAAEGARHLGERTVKWAKKHGSELASGVRNGLAYVNKVGIVGAVGVGLRKGASFLGKHPFLAAASPRSGRAPRRPWAARSPRSATASRRATSTRRSWPNRPRARCSSPRSRSARASSPAECW